MSKHEKTHKRLTDMVNSGKGYLEILAQVVDESNENHYDAAREVLSNRTRIQAMHKGMEEFSLAVAEYVEVSMDTIKCLVTRVSELERAASITHAEEREVSWGANISAAGDNQFTLGKSE